MFYSFVIHIYSDKFLQFMFVSVFHPSSFSLFADLFFSIKYVRICIGEDCKICSEKNNKFNIKRKVDWHCPKSMRELTNTFPYNLVMKGVCQEGLLLIVQPLGRTNRAPF